MTVSFLSETISNYLKTAKANFAVLKSASSEEGRFGGCEAAWSKEVQGALRSCISVGVAGAGVKGLCGKIGVEGLGDVLGKKDGLGSIEVKIPEVGERYHGWWIVPKVGERK